MKTVIAVIGPSHASEKQKKVAEKVGILIAKREGVVLCGGMEGVMESACRGAKSVGGTTVGILPGTDLTSANRFIDIPVVTGMGEARNVIVAKSGHCVIAIGGELGTLTEISFALKSQIPVVGLDTWDLSDEIIRCQKPEKAVETAFSLSCKATVSTR